MSERKRERARRKVSDPLEPRTTETRKGKQTKFVLDVGDLDATPEQLEDIRSSILRNSIDLIRERSISTSSGGEFRPKVGVEEFSVSFSVSFSLGA